MAEEEFVAEWFRYAFMDFDNAKFLFENRYPPPLEIICYHCQQSAEKYLKGILVSYDIEPEKTHDLNKLIVNLKNFIDIPSDIDDYAESLTHLAIKTRYPNAIFIDEDITKTALAQANIIKNWAEKVMAEQKLSK